MSKKTAIMIVGCTSDAGKSFLAAALCRRLRQAGEKVAPFKAQNMSNNAAVCADGSEIGRAQYVQAQAAQVEPQARMNPVLLKPQADTNSQVIVMGHYDPLISQTPWLERRAILWPIIQKAYDSLSADYERIIIEGAGSPAEPNLMPFDLVNMAVARHAQAACYLVADIDRGGAFAHLLGTWQTLEPADRALIKGFVLNKFRGDPALLLNARQWLEERTGIPTVALVPYRQHLLPEEDGFFHRSTVDLPGVRIGLLLYPWASNLDEFDPLAYQEGVNLIPIKGLADFQGLDALILPGSKSTIDSLRYIHQQGLVPAITAMVQAQKPVYGICGGMQILGHKIEDPTAIEGTTSAQGLGLLNINTLYAARKTTRQCTTSTSDGLSLEGYEIHLGQSTALAGVQAHLADGLGWRQGHVTGVYLHGIFQNDQYRAQFLHTLGWTGQIGNWQERLAAEYDRVASLIDLSGWFDHLPDRPI